MKVYVDISLYTETDAFGRISGHIHVPVAPQIGDLISFDLSKGDGELVEVGIYVEPVKVTDRIIPADADGEIALSLSDITIQTRDGATRVMKYFEAHYGLFGEPYIEDNVSDQ